MTMSIRVRILAIALALSFGVVAAARAADVNAVGTWTGNMDTQMGSVLVTIAIDKAAPLSGQVTLGQFGGPISNGKLDNDKVTFDVNIEHGTLKFDGTVAGDEMKLTVTGTQGDKMSLVAKRQK